MLVIQLNELNFDYAKHYIEKYNLVNFKSLIKLNNCITSSETKYETLEPGYNGLHLIQVSLQMNMKFLD